MTALPDSNAFQDNLKQGSRLQRELETLRNRIADLELLEHELSRAALAAYAESGPADPDQVKAEIASRLRYVPLFYTPALGRTELLLSIWAQHQAGYLDNPLPELFKERLCALLACHCPSPYALVMHCCDLHARGVAAPDILALLEGQSGAGPLEVREIVKALQDLPHPLAEMPQPGSKEENLLLQAAVFLFMSAPPAEQCVSELRLLLGLDRYRHLVALMAYARCLHVWLETHPEISYHTDPQIREQLLPLLQAEPRFTELFRSYYSEFSRDRHRLEATEALRASEERYRDLFENANDMVYTLDLEGNLTSLNKAAERITGYSREEALDMNFLQFVAPEHRDSARRLLGRRKAGDSPTTDEIEIVTREGQTIALEISTHLIMHEGKPIGLQGIARDVTERKRTEEALQQAKHKLEAWVDELEQRTREMTLLSEMGDLLRACLTTEEAYTVIVRFAQQIFPVEVGSLYVISSSRNVVEAVAVWGNASRAEHMFSPEECWGLRRGRVHWVQDTRVGLLCKHLRHPPPEGYLCVPMMAQSEALGVLHLSQPTAGRLSEAKQRLAIAMAEHIAMALSNLRLHETLRSQSIRDPLTGLFNRRFMEESLELELRRAVRNSRPLGVIMVDLDRFKNFNDQFGHDAGDTLLRQLGNLLQSNIRAEDIACRYGGEEFTLILPEGNAEITEQRAHALRDAVQKLEVQHRGQPLGRLTASLGVAVFPDHARTAEALLQAADAALYLSKDAGGDTVTIAR